MGFSHDEATFTHKEHPEVFHLDEATLTSQAHARLGENAGRILAVYKKTFPNATPSELYISMATARWMGNDTITLAERKSAQPAPVYVYRYDYSSNVPIEGTDWTLRAGHATEIAMKFYNYDIPALEGKRPRGRRGVEKHGASFWTSFARHGHPEVQGCPPGRATSLEHRSTMLINSQCQVVSDPDSPIRQSMGRACVANPPMSKQFMTRAGFALLFILARSVVLAAPPIAAKGHGAAAAEAQTSTATTTPVLIDRNGSLVSIQAFGPNIMRVTLGVDKDTVLAPPGFGINGAPDDRGWKHQASAAGDEFSSEAFSLLVKTQPYPGPPSQMARRISRRRRCRRSPHHAVRSPSGAPVLDMSGWEMAPHTVNGEKTFRVGATFLSPSDEHY